MFIMEPEPGIPKAVNGVVERFVTIQLITDITFKLQLAERQQLGID